MNVASLLRAAMSDIVEACRNYHVALVFGWQDVAQRYRRSKLGAFWITISVAVMIGTLSFLFGILFKAPLQQFLPFVGVGLILWTFMSTMVNEGCTTFIEASGMILQVRLPLFTHILRMTWRNLIILAHNLIIVPLIFIAMGIAPTTNWLLAIPGLLLLVANMVWIALVLAVLSARFRDITQAVQSAMQIAFFLTPIMWLPQSIAAHASENILKLNPFYHLVAIVRDPLIGATLDPANWIVSIGLAIAGWFAALLFYGRFQRRVPYWL